MSAPATPAPAPRAFSLAELAIDIVSLFVAYFPLRPRLRLIACVCRRWRAAAYLSVTSIPPPLCYLGPLDRFPNLTACHFDEWTAVPPTWTPEQQARIRSVSFRTPLPRVLKAATFPSLTSLKVEVGERALAILPEILLTHASSLVHLKVDASPLRNYYEPPSLPQLPTSLSALRSLSLLSVVDASPFSSVFSQLTRLKSWSPSVLLHPLPQLRCLSIKTLTLTHVSLASLASLPSLTSLRIGRLIPASRDEHVSFPSALERLSPVLTSLSLDKQAVTLAALREVLPACKRLTHVSLMRGSLSLLPALLPLAVHITSMEVITGDYPSEEMHYLTQNFTALTKLRLRPNGLDVALPNWRLPHLRELHSGEVALAWLTRALRAFPTLLHLTVSGVLPAASAEVRAFEAEVRAADRRGMHMISIAQCRSVDVKALRQSLRWLAFRVELVLDVDTTDKQEGCVAS